MNMSSIAIMMLASNKTLKIYPSDFDEFGNLSFFLSKATQNQKKRNNNRNTKVYKSIEYETQTHIEHQYKGISS